MKNITMLLLIMNFLLLPLLTATENDVCPTFCSCNDGLILCSGKEFNDLRYFRKNRFGRNLTLLYLSHIGATHIPSQAFKSSQLSTLREMKLMDSDLVTIHRKAFYDLTALEVLDLQNNRIASLNKAVFNANMKLKVLRLNANNISKITFVNKLPELKILNLAHNYIRTLRGRSFCASPYFPSNIEKLVLNHNKIDKIGNIVFSCLKHVVEIDLSHNNLLVLEGKTFRNSRKLMTLKANDNSILQINGIWRITNLVQLYLQNNQIEDLRKHALGKNGYLSSLRNINLSSNRIATISDNGLFSYLKNLNFLYLSSNRILSIAIDVFVNNTQLIYLDVRNNSISDYSFVDRRRTVLVK